MGPGLEIFFLTKKLWIILFLCIINSSITLNLRCSEWSSGGVPPSLSFVPSWSPGWLRSRVGESENRHTEAHEEMHNWWEPFSRCVCSKDFRSVKEVLPSKRNGLRNPRVLEKKYWSKWVEREGVTGKEILKQVSVKGGSDSKGTSWKWLSTKNVSRRGEWVFWLCLRVQERAGSETLMQMRKSLVRVCGSYVVIKKEEVPN